MSEDASRSNMLIRGAMIDRTSDAAVQEFLKTRHRRSLAKSILYIKLRFAGTHIHTGEGEIVFSLSARYGKH